ncbi:MAG: winged helix-turn-helix domain-containing protein [Nitrososphaerota archaeon]|nr:winged helix-turn-helix domain-containing protein [Nitrososphaerota archaeon]
MVRDHGEARSDDVVCSSVSLPKPHSSSLSEIDLKILLALQGNPRMTLRDIAGDADVSTKTVARALRRLYIHRMAGRKMKEHWAVVDWLGMMRQMDVVPSRDQ